MVMEGDAMWFEDGSPLTQKLCEDMRQPDDVAPQLNYDCQICDEAKYEVSFHTPFHINHIVHILS